MFKSKPKFDVNTLKLNIKLAIERINIVKRKKVELSKRTRKNVADLISKQEITSATIKTEQLIRDDNLIEAMDVVKNYLEILHSRSGLIQTQQNIDESLTIAVMSMIWVDPRLSCDIPELSIISKQFLSKYGKQFYDTAISNSLQLVFPHLVSLLSVEPPSDCLIDQYMKAIAEAHHVQFTSTYVDKNEHLTRIENELVNSFLSSQSDIDASLSSLTDSNFLPNAQPHNTEKTLINDTNSVDSPIESLDRIYMGIKDENTSRLIFDDMEAEALKEKKIPIVPNLDRHEKDLLAGSNSDSGIRNYFKIRRARSKIGSFKISVMLLNYNSISHSLLNNILAFYYIRLMLKL
ncbi:hypothetical protein HZS_622, partial [Henneguya salminicola]